MSRQESGINPRDEQNLPRRWLDMESQHGIHSHNELREDLGDDEIFIYLPFSDLRGWIYEKEDIYKASQVLPIDRLQYIRQLSFLAYIGPKPETQYLHEFNHTRRHHVLQTARIVEAVLQRNHADKDTVKKGVVASLIHDQATPALGDAAKKIDPVNLNEEDLWHEVMDKEAWAYLKDEEITFSDIDDAVHNRGLVGKVLDVADRISYVMTDLSQLINTDILDSDLNNSHRYGYRAQLAEVLQQDTNVGSIYKDMEINWETQEVFFRNPERLGRFLELRALLNKYLYMHPVSQARDLVVGRFMKPFYTPDSTDDTKLNPKILRRIIDEDAIGILEQKNPDKTKKTHRDLFSGADRLNLYYVFVHWYPEFYPKFSSLKKLKEAKEGLVKEGFIVNGWVESKGFNPLTDYKVVNDMGEIIPFNEYDPQCAGRIERIAQDTKGYYLFYQNKTRNFETGLIDSDIAISF